MEFIQTSTNTLIDGKKVIRFGDLDFILKVTLAIGNLKLDKRKLM